jgi:hypothetical protein
MKNGEKHEKALKENEEWRTVLIPPNLKKIEKHYYDDWKEF